MNKKELINEITEHFPSVYTKDDVVKLINLLDDTQQKIDVEELKRRLRNKIERLRSEDVVDYSTVELSMNYDNRVEVEGMEVQNDTIMDEIEETIDEYFDEKEIVHDGE
jgi:tRNA U34 5-carboxymethylaminomethyl modifying GTPase MnmE/TrmE